MPAVPHRTDKPLVTLKKRKEFVKLRAGRRIHTRGFVLQYKSAAAPATGHPRFGFTVTKRVGNAVVRNRIRRRLRELVRTCLTKSDKLKGDFVLIGKFAALHLRFDLLVSDLMQALDQMSTLGSKPKPIPSSK